MTRAALRGTLFLTTALQAVAWASAFAQPAPTARPSGGTVVAGQAVIDQTAARTVVKQASQRAAVDWQSFDVGSSHTVQFQQPAATAVALNRVVGRNPSEIAGRIDANGQVVIVNQAGILFHKGAQVDTAGLVASAAGISTGNFLGGRMVFDQQPNPGARVENRGTITIRERGMAALVAPQVTNSGVIRATMGTVILAGAEAHTLDLYGDGMVSINVTRQVRSAPDGGVALVTNTGTIAAAGGKVLLTAEAVDGVVQTLVNAGGHISADTMAGRVGQVAVSGRGGNVIVAGTMTAKAADANAAGGTVIVNTHGTIVAGNASRVDVSGPGAGGTIAIGTKGTGGLAAVGQSTAKAVTIAPGARLSADATVIGGGGRVVVLSSGTTRMDGNISARGGAKGGDGGFIEVSGGRLASITGHIDAGAPSGRLGTILLDPDFLDIIDAASGAGSQDPFINGGTILARDPSVPPDTVSNGVLNALVGNVLLQANQTISVKGNVSLTNTTGQSLSLEAGGTIVVQAGVQLTASGDIIVATGGAGSTSPPTARPAPLISIAGTVTSETGTIGLLAGSAGSVVIGGTVAAAAITLNAPAGIELSGTSLLGRTGAIIDMTTLVGGVTQVASAMIVAGSLRSTGTIVGNVSLTGTRNAVAAIGEFGVSGPGNSFTLINTGDVSINGPLIVPHNIGIASATGSRIAVTGTVANTTGALAIIAGTGGIALDSGARILAGRVGLTAQGAISLSGGARIGLAGGLIDFRTTAGGVTQDPGAMITAANLQSTSGVVGPVSLAGTANAIGAIGSFAVTGAGAGFSLNNAGDLSIKGALTALGDIAFATAAGSSKATGLISVSGTIRSGGLVALRAADAGISLNTGAVVGGTTAVIAAGGPVTLSSGARLGQNGAIVDLSTRAGGIEQHPGATIIAEILSSALGVLGSATLAGASNAIGTVAAFATTGAFTLVDTGNLTVSGPLRASGDLSLTTNGTGRVSLAGTVGTNGGLSILSGAGGIALNSGGVVTAPTITLSGQSSGITIAPGATLGQAGATIDVSTTGGGIVQDPKSIIRAAVLRSGGVSGTANLAGIANEIAELGSFTVTGLGSALIVVDTGNLLAMGEVRAPGSIFLGTSGTGAVTATAPITAGTSLTVISGKGGIALTNGASLSAGEILLQARGPITLAQDTLLGQAGANLDITTTDGGVTQDAGARIVAATLRSSAGIGGSVALQGSLNAIETLAGLGIDGGNLTLVDTNGITVSGSIGATGAIGITTSGGIAIQGSLRGNGVGSYSDIC